MSFIFSWSTVLIRQLARWSLCEFLRYPLKVKNANEYMKDHHTHNFKVKCNEIWTISLLSKNLNKKVSCTNTKKNQLFEISFVRTVALKTRKSDDFRELHENEPEMAALGVETNYRYLWRHSWRAYLRGHIISLKSLSLFWRFSGIYWLANEQNRPRPWVLTWKCPNTAI